MSLEGFWNSCLVIAVKVIHEYGTPAQQLKLPLFNDCHYLVVTVFVVLKSLVQFMMHTLG